MCKKKFLMSLICLVVALSFSATATRGANILFVSSSSGGDPADDLIKAFMEGLGHTVTYIDDDDDEATTEAAAIAADLVFISETVQSSGIGDEITEVAVPIIVVEGSAWDNMGLTEGGGGDEVTETTDVDIVAPGHYLAAGLSGTVAVLTNIPGGCELGRGIAGPEATVIATAKLADNVTYDVIFVYEKGAALAAAPTDGSAQVAAGIRIAFGGFKSACNAAFSDNAYALLGAAMNYALGFSGAPPGQAKEPYPDDEDKDVSRDVTLSWMPGEFAPAVNGHRLYLSDNFDEVSNEIGGITLSDASYAPPQRLELGTTYYWRVDEVNAPPDSTVYPGEVWSFTTEPGGYPIDGGSIIATASSQGQANVGPENTINNSGLDPNDLHSTIDSDMWLSGQEPEGAWIQYQFDKPHKLHEMWVWNYNSESEATFGFGLKDVTVEYSQDGIAYTTLGTTHEFLQAPAPAGPYAHNTTVDFGGVLAKFVKLTTNSNWTGAFGALPSYGLSEVRFFAIPLSARKLYPDSDAADVDVNVTLTWRAGREADTHDVYLDTDQQAVTDGTIQPVSVTDASYASTIDLDSTYFWRVDEVNEAETPPTWQGDVQSFSTQEYLVVDDFEDYNDYMPDEIFSTWIDGYGVPTNGALAAHDVAPWAETTTVHGGSRQAMPMFYGNTGGATFSEVERTFDVPQDWTKHGIQTLVLYFHGTPGNTGQLYARVNGVKVPYDGDATAMVKVRWQQWNIDLASLGVSLQSITKLAVGIDDIGAGGMLYVDDIVLYRLAPEVVVPSEEYWIEAEAATTIEAPMQIYADDPTALGGKYIMKDPIAAESLGNPPADGLVTYTFTVAGGTYKIAGRVISSGANDSFWVRIPGATTQTTNHSSGWIRWAGMTQAGVWGWEDVFSDTDTGNPTVEFTMPAGTYTLELRYREDLTQLDVLVITSIN